MSQVAIPAALNNEFSANSYSPRQRIFLKENVLQNCKTSKHTNASFLPVNPSIKKPS